MLEENHRKDRDKKKYSRCDYSVNYYNLNKRFGIIEVKPSKKGLKFHDIGDQWCERTPSFSPSMKSQDRYRFHGQIPIFKRKKKVVHSGAIFNIIPFTQLILLNLKKKLNKNRMKTQNFFIIYLNDKLTVLPSGHWPCIQISKWSNWTGPKK